MCTKRDRQHEAVCVYGHRDIPADRTVKELESKFSSRGNLCSGETESRRECRMMKRQNNEQPYVPQTTLTQIC